MSKVKLIFLNFFALSVSLIGFRFWNFKFRVGINEVLINQFPCSSIDLRVCVFVKILGFMFWVNWCRICYKFLHFGPNVEMIGFDNEKMVIDMSMI